MKCLVFVKFLPGVSLPPEELLAGINSQWIWLEGTDDKQSLNSAVSRTTSFQSPRAAICIADYESIDQLAIAVAIMPGAGISNIEVVPISEDTEFRHLFTDVPARTGKHQQELGVVCPDL